MQNDHMHNVVKNITIGISILAGVVVMAMPFVVSAQDIVVPPVEKGPPVCTYDPNDSGGVLWEHMEACRQCGNCTLTDFVRLADNVAQWILGIVGSLALLMFVYGGVVWIISGGSSEQVQKGKDTVKNAIIGLVLVFISWLIVSVVVRALVCDPAADNCSGNIFDRPWQEAPRE